MEILKSAKLEDEYFFAEGCYILELSNSPDDEDVSVARARVLPGVTTERHYLVDTTERYVILEGTGCIDIGDVVAQVVAPHDVVVIPPLCHQRITNTGSTDLVFLAICSPRFRPACYRAVVDDDPQ